MWVVKRAEPRWAGQAAVRVCTRRRAAERLRQATELGELAVGDGVRGVSEPSVVRGKGSCGGMLCGGREAGVVLLVVAGCCCGCPDLPYQAWERVHRHHSHRVVRSFLSLFSSFLCGPCNSR